MLKFLIKKLLLIIIGVILSLVILECGLRVAGWTISSYQQYKNNKALKNKSQYTIMCLGESTTQSQYPIQLQQLLDEKYPNKFSVIDCGLRSSNLETVLNVLDNNINKYNPDIAICMMGVNNSRNFTSNTNNFNDYYIAKSKKITFKVIKLFILIKQHIKNLKTAEAFAQNTESNYDLLVKAITLQHENKFEKS
ncbi:MAG: hypothetical protein K5622_02845, partial [Endomicrobiaceae bacterium]|nr:hypothetical protein [Endomicrobiaceae bacterium]